MAVKILLEAEYDERVKSSFVHCSAMRSIGTKRTLVTLGIVEIKMLFSGELTK